MGRFMSKEGLTLIELLCVIAIIGILASIATPLFITYRDRAMILEAEVEIRVLEKEITSYFITRKEYPESLDDIGYVNFLDPWKNPYQYLRIYEDDPTWKGKGKAKNPMGVRKDRNLHPINSDFDLYSMGKDGKSVLPLTAQPSQDDVIRANDGDFIGLACLY